MNSNKIPFLLSEWKISQWAYQYCNCKKNDSKIRECIIHSYWAYLYCRNIKDDPRIRQNITTRGDAYVYCRDISTNDKRLFKLAKGYTGIIIEDGQ